jgi:hypothetical protein
MVDALPEICIRNALIKMWYTQVEILFIDEVCYTGILLSMGLTWLWRHRRRNRGDGGSISPTFIPALLVLLFLGRLSPPREKFF